VLADSHLTLYAAGHGIYSFSSSIADSALLNNKTYLYQYALHEVMWKSQNW
jgi:hypothetical protein